jgi:hypothetical protein
MVKLEFSEILIFLKKKLFFYVFEHFKMLILKINFKKLKNIILINFQKKNTIKNNRYHYPKHL